MKNSEEDIKEILIKVNKKSKSLTPKKSSKSKKIDLDKFIGYGRDNIESNEEKKENFQYIFNYKKDKEIIE